MCCSFLDGGNDFLLEEPPVELVLSQIGPRPRGVVTSTTIEVVDVPGEFCESSATPSNVNTCFARRDDSSGLDVDGGYILSRILCSLEANATDLEMDLGGEAGGTGGSADRVASLRSAGRSDTDTAVARSPASPASVPTDLAVTHRAAGEHQFARSTQATAASTAAAAAAAVEEGSLLSAAVSRRTGDRDVSTAGPARPDLFTPPLSTPRGHSACRSSPLAGGASRAKGTRSPVSNRIDVLQTLLAPADRRKGDRDEENVARLAMKGVSTAKAGVSSSGGGSWGRSGDSNVDALEHLLLDNTITTAMTTPSKNEVPVDDVYVAAPAGSGNDDHGDVGGHTANRQKINVNIIDFGSSSSNDVGTDRGRDNCPRQTLSHVSPRTRTSESYSFRRASMTTNERTRRPGTGARSTGHDETTAARPKNCGAGGSKDAESLSFAPDFLGNGLRQTPLRDRLAIGDEWENETGRVGPVQEAEAGRDRHQMEELEVCVLVAMLCTVYDTALDGAGELKVWGDSSACCRNFTLCASVSSGRGHCLCGGSYGGAICCNVVHARPPDYIWGSTLPAATCGFCFQCAVGTDNVLRSHFAVRIFAEKGACACRPGGLLSHGVWLRRPQVIRCLSTVRGL